MNPARDLEVAPTLGGRVFHILATLGILKLLQR